jgi:hypothetical protein
MVFENLTLFELHVEDAQFGPTTLPDGEQATAESETDEAPDETTDTGRREGGARRRVLLLAVASVAVSVAATALARRLAGADESASEAPTVAERPPETSAEA